MSPDLIAITGDVSCPCQGLASIQVLTAGPTGGGPCKMNCLPPLLAAEAASEGLGARAMEIYLEGQREERVWGATGQGG